MPACGLFFLYNQIMLLKSSANARAFGADLASILTENGHAHALRILTPVITDRNPFRLLDLVGQSIAACPAGPLFTLLDAVAGTHAEGGWVIIASALRARYAQSPALRLERTRSYIIQADVWYGADIFGERVPGPFLVDDFDRTLPLLTPWVSHPNPWVRRTTGVAVHFWAKRTRAVSPAQAQQLFDFLSPLLEERDIRAAKGIGWGLKTLGRYYPALAADWLRQQLFDQHRQPIAIVRRKALTYLPDNVKQELSR